MCSSKEGVIRNVRKIPWNGTTRQMLLQNMKEPQFLSDKCSYAFSHGTTQFYVKNPLLQIYLAMYHL